MKQNNDKNYKKFSQEVTLHLCIQYSRPIALSKIFLVLLPPDAHSTDTGLDPSTLQINFYNTCTALFSYMIAFTPSLHCPLLLCYMHMVTCCDMHHLIGCPLALYANIRVHVLNTLLPSSWSLSRKLWKHLSPCLGRDWHKGKLGGLISGPSWVTILLDAAAFCYIILEMMHASIWPETREYDLPPNMLRLCICDCACLRKIVLLYILIDSSMLMSPTFCVFLCFTIQDWLMIQLIAGMKRVVKCPSPYFEL